MPGSRASSQRRSERGSSPGARARPRRPFFVGLLLGGLALEVGRSREVELPVFAGLFAGALLCRLVSSAFLAAQSERPGLARSHRALGPAAVWKRLRGAGSVPVLTYLLAMQGVTHIAAPYFTPYMLGPLELSYGQFMTLIAASFLARVAVLPLLGRLAQERGTRHLLWLGGVGIVPLPLLWLVSHAFAYLLVVQLLAGVAWAAVEFATTLSFFERIEESDRASVLAAFNLCNALAIALGALVGAQLFAWLDGSAAGYAWLFAVSSAGRLLSVALLRRTPAAEHVPRTCGSARWRCDPRASPCSARSSPASAARLPRRLRRAAGRAETARMPDAVSSVNTL